MAAAPGFEHWWARAVVIVAAAGIALAVAIILTGR